MIQREMELKRASYVVVFVILLCALAIASSEGRRKTIEMVLANADDCHFTSLELEAHMVMHLFMLFSLPLTMFESFFLSIEPTIEQ